MGDSKIEWTDKVWNCVRGCSLVSEGCTRCYAERFAARGLPGMLSPTTGEAFATMTPNGPRWTGKVELIPSKLAEPLSWPKPARIFVNSMSDLFHEALPAFDIAKIFAIMAEARCHAFQVLTKRPERALELLADPAWAAVVRAEWADLAIKRQPGLAWAVVEENSHSLPWPLPNVWLGTSVEDQATADARIPSLLQCPAAVRFVSYEPALGPVDFSHYLPATPIAECPAEMLPYYNTHFPLHWLICGGESGPGARPMNPDWARSARDQCVAAGVAFFFKQWGEYVWRANRNESTGRPKHHFDDGVWVERVGKRVAGRELDGRTWDEFPEVAHA